MRGGFGDVAKDASVFVANELQPLQDAMRELNNMIGQEVIRFAKYDLSALIS